jgi:DNA modification methylase
MNGRITNELNYPDLNQTGHKMLSIQQLDFFSETSRHMGGKNSTHSGGKGEIFHDWFPYLEGFSSNFVKSVRQKYLPNSHHIIEPFAGIGTTPVYLAQDGVLCSYCEVNPVLLHLIRTKIKALTASQRTREKIADQLEAVQLQLAKIGDSQTADPIAETYFAAFGSSAYFRHDNFRKILALKAFGRTLFESDAPFADYFEVAVYSSLLEASLLKRAGDVRFKTPKELECGIPDIEDLVAKRLAIICADLRDCSQIKQPPALITPNAKLLTSTRELKADGVITSPPYLNGTNYLRNTRLELWYREHLTSRNSLRTFRDDALTAGINDVTVQKPFEVLPEVKATYDRHVRKAYDRRIPQMIASYFFEMKAVLLGLKRNVREGGGICIDIGDSIYSGEHVPTHDIFIAIGESIGLAFLEQITLRERMSYNKEKLTQRLLAFKT